MTNPRTATEDDIEAALERSYVSLPITNATDLLEAFNCILDHLTGEADRAERDDEERIAKERKRRSN